jgi:predicted RNA-binding Zn-ribbon protein involved in translation (DUF1610 family)
MEEILEQEKTLKQAIKFKKEKIVKGMTCPACSGELDMNEGLRSFNCKYCGTLLVVKGESGSLKFFVPRKLNRDQAIANAFNWLGKGIAKASGLKAASKIEEAFLVYIPYWRVRSDVVGWIFGQEKRTRTVNNRTTTYYVDVEKKIQQTFDRTFPACDVAELGVKKVNLEGDEILPVDFDTLQRDGMIFNIISSEKEVEDYAKQNFSSEARNSVHLYNITFEHYDLVREDIHIVYYPLWIVRYNYSNRVYQVVVDGEDGSVCYGKAPGNNLYRAIMGIFGVCAGMYLATLFGVFALLGSADEFPIIAYLFCLVLGIGLIYWGYRKFRYGGEVEEGTGIIKSKKQTNPVLNKINNPSMNVAKNVATSVMIGSVAGAIFRSIRK